MSSVLAASLPPKTDPRWARLVTDGPGQPVKLLALKFMLTRMSQDIKRDPTPKSVIQTVDELYGFFSKNPRMVEPDRSNLFG